MKRLIIFLIRRRLHLKKGQRFRFVNQYAKDDFYFFESKAIKKYSSFGNVIRDSTVSLNWLLNDECEITLIDK